MGIFKRKKTKQVEEMQPIPSPVSGFIYPGPTDYNKPKLKPMQSLLIALLRHVLTFIGATIVSKGLIDEATMVELVGAAISFLSVGWMAVDKVKKKPE